jgi:hypothetical protein
VTASVKKRQPRETQKSTENRRDGRDEKDAKDPRRGHSIARRTQIENQERKAVETVTDKGTLAPG